MEKLFINEDEWENRELDEITPELLHDMAIHASFICLLARGQVHLDTLERFILSMGMPDEVTFMGRENQSIFSQISLDAWSHYMKLVKADTKDETPPLIREAKIQAYEAYGKFFKEKVWSLNVDGRKRLNRAFGQWIEHMRGNNARSHLH